MCITCLVRNCIIFKCINDYFCGIIIFFKYQNLEIENMNTFKQKNILKTFMVEELPFLGAMMINLFWIFLTSFSHIIDFDGMKVN